MAEKWPDFGTGALCPPELYLLRTKEWVNALWGWPMGTTLDGPGRRDLTRLAAIVVALEEARLRSERLTAPPTWVSNTDTQRHTYFKEQVKEIVAFQLRMVKQHGFK